MQSEPVSESPWQRRQRKWRQSLDKFIFYSLIHGDIARNHATVLRQAEAALHVREMHESDDVCLNSPDLVVRQGWQLKKHVEAYFKGRHSHLTDQRFLLHVPPAHYSPAGFSIFTNLAECLQFIGVPTQVLDWDANTADVFRSFQPSVLLTSDHHTYLERIDWSAIAAYRKTTLLRVGLTASLEAYENTPLLRRMEWAKAHAVDFFYSYRDPSYVRSRIDYQPFFEAGYPMLFLPFGANILHYYPVAGFERNLDFALLATRKSEHMTYMREIVRFGRGFIDGPGWRHVENFSFNRDRDRYIYASAKIGLNVHLPEQLNWACELNERTYQLAACGVPQLIDHPRLFDAIFGEGMAFVAESPAEYAVKYRQILGDPNIRQEYALRSQRHVFDQHTTFHRAESLITQIRGFFAEIT